MAHETLRFHRYSIGMDCGSSIPSSQKDNASLRSCGFYLIFDLSLGQVAVDHMSRPSQQDSQMLETYQGMGGSKSTALLDPAFYVS